MSSDRTILFTGDDWDIPQLIETLDADGVSDGGTDVSTATDITAQIVDSDSDSDTPTLIIGPVTCLVGATGADWANGIVIAPFVSAATAVLTPQRGYLEMQVTIGGKKTTWPRTIVDIKAGTIT